MTTEEKPAKQVWRFAYQTRNGKRLEGTFVANEQEIEWITGQIINFGEVFEEGLATVVKIEEDHFEVVNENAEFAEQFAASIGTAGKSPFAEMDDEQFAEWDALFGDGEPEPVEPSPAFVDEGTHVVTYDLTEYIIGDDLEGVDEELYERAEEFLDRFAIIEPQDAEVHLAANVDPSDDQLKCMKVIQRHSDGAMFGYVYYEGNDYIDFPSNGSQFNIAETEDTHAYVWLPVKPFTIIGYKLAGRGTRS